MISYREYVFVGLAVFVLKCSAAEPRGPASDEDIVVLKTAQLEVMVGNNCWREADGVRHHAGYNGLFSIRAKQQAESPFVPAYAGWNLEHYFDARPRADRNVFFEPRFAEMKTQRIDPQTVELHQPATPVYQVESWTRFSVVEPNAIDFSFRCRPHRDDYAGDFLGMFWASYINGPNDKSMYFLDADSTRQKPLWRQLCTQQHNLNSTVRFAGDRIELSFESDDALFANESPLRYSAPFFYGRFRNMVLIYVFRPDPNLRFTHSPTGGGMTADGTDTNPAWDFQWIIPQPEKNHEYQLQGRLIYKPWRGRQDVLAEVARYLPSDASE